MKKMGQRESRMSSGKKWKWGSQNEIKKKTLPLFTIDNKRGKWPGNGEEKSEAQKI